MRMRLHIAALLLLAGSAPAQVVDRMVAVVNKRVVLESELDQSMRVEFLLQGRPLSTLTNADKAAELERLIDRALLDQQVLNATMLDPSADELAAKVREVRESVSSPATPGGKSGDDRWKALLASYGLTQQDVEEQLTAQIRILRLVDLRFRGLVRVEKDAIEAYYQDKFVPEMRKRNADPPALAVVSDKIERILTEERIDALLNSWLKALRAQARIEKMLGSAAGGLP